MLSTIDAVKKKATKLHAPYRVLSALTAPTPQRFFTHKVAFWHFFADTFGLYILHKIKINQMSSFFSYDSAAGRAGSFTLNDIAL